jgi:hypothetical protein
MSDVSRRAVLRGAVVAGVGAAVPVAAASPALAATTTTAAAPPLRRSTFKPLLNQSFTLTTASRKSYSAKLAAIGDYNAATAGSDQSFTLLFKGTVPPAGICTVSSGKLKPVSLFLSPVGNKAGVAQAVIST